MLESTASRFDTFPPQGLAAIGWSLAKFGLSPPDTWLKTFVEAVDRKLEGCTPFDLVNITWALAVMGHQPTEDQLDR